MENMDKKEGGCMCGCHGGRHHLVKVILKLIIVILIFWCGFKLGEMTGYIQSEYGRGMGMMMNRGGGYGMMGGYDSNNLPNANSGVSAPTK